MTTSMLYPRNTRSRRVVDLSGLWDFRFDPEGTGQADGWTRGFKGGIQLPVPASFCDFFTDKESREYAGDFWYQTLVFVPEEWKGQRVVLRFGSATHRAIVWLNGVEVARHEGGFLPFTADITEAAHYNAENRLVVWLNNELSFTTLPAGRTITLKSGRKMNKPFFDFYNYSGLQRPVKLCCLPEERVTDLTVNHRLAEEDALVDYLVETTGDHLVTVCVFDQEGHFIVEAQGKTGTLRIPDVRLWQVRDAYLYKFIVKITSGGQLVDEYWEDIGIRTVEIQGTQILINGKPVYLKGFGKHEESDIVGRAYNLPVIKRDFELMKWIGANSFRTSHYPYSEEIYQMADREGFLVIDEVPAVGFMESLMNFKDAADGKMTAWFDRDTVPQLLENHKNAIREMIKRDKNHACVFAWSLMNEPDTLTDSASVYFKEVFAYAHELDVQKRPRTFAMLGNSTPGKCKCFQYCDLLTLNRYFGWYLLAGNELEDGEALFRQEMDSWQALPDQKPMVFTEYGADTLVGLHKLPSVQWSEEYQREYLEMCHRVFDDYPFVKGEQVWNFADFQTTEGIMRVDGNKKGIFTRQRQPKAIAWYFKSRWESLPLDYKAE